MYAIMKRMPRIRKCFKDPLDIGRVCRRSPATCDYPVWYGVDSMQEISLFEKGKDGNSFSEICTAIHCNPCVPGWPDRFGRAIQVPGFLPQPQDPDAQPVFRGRRLDIGFADAGFDIIASVEVEDKFCATLRLNSGAGKQFPAAHVNCIDIREFKPDGLGKIDFIIGGPPCQTFSAAGEERMAYWGQAIRAASCSRNMSGSSKRSSRKDSCSRTCMASSERSRGSPGRKS